MLSYEIYLNSFNKSKLITDSFVIVWLAPQSPLFQAVQSELIRMMGVIVIKRARVLEFFFRGFYHDL